MRGPWLSPGRLKIVIKRLLQTASAYNSCFLPSTFLQSFWIRYCVWPLRISHYSTTTHCTVKLDWFNCWRLLTGGPTLKMHSTFYLFISPSENSTSSSFKPPSSSSSSSPESSSPSSPSVQSSSSSPSNNPPETHEDKNYTCLIVESRSTTYKGTKIIYSL